MDTGKLLKIIEDIQQDESKFSFQNRLQNILSYYNDNNAEALNQERDSLSSDIRNSIVSNYVLTELKALEKISAENFFGLEFEDSLNSALRSESHEVKLKLTQLTERRQDLLNKLIAIKNSLNTVGLEARILKENEYELGFSLPEIYGDLDRLEDLIGDLNKFLMELAGTDEESKKFKIVSVENGSIDLYLSAAEQLANNFDLAIDYILKIYGFITMCKEIKKGYAHYKDKNKKKNLDAIHDEQLKFEKESLLEEFTEKIGAATPEEKSRIKGLLKEIVKHFENGVSAEVRTPPMEKPREITEGDSDETKAQITKQHEKYSVKKMIDERNQKMLELQRNDFYGMKAKLLEDGSQDNLDSEES